VFFEWTDVRDWMPLETKTRICEDTLSEFGVESKGLTATGSAEFDRPESEVKEVRKEVVIKGNRQPTSSFTTASDSNDALVPAGSGSSANDSPEEDRLEVRVVL
jgi:hypothetical protein